MKPNRLQRLLDAFRSKRILVIGDLMLDEFIWGKVSRISPEAPVPVVEVERESYYPGGSANVARNLRQFSRDVRVMGLIGAGVHGDLLQQLLLDQQINIDALQQDSGVRTVVKTRIIAKHQQVVRVDRDARSVAGRSALLQALRHLEKTLPDLDAIILEDYGKGLLQQWFVDRVSILAQRKGTILTVDPNLHNPLRYRHATAITPNRTEAFAAAGKTSTDPQDPPAQDAALLSVGKRLLKKWRTSNLLITLGEQGMMLFRMGEDPLHIPTRAQQVYDVSGAGDTAIALFTLALCSGATPLEAAEISNHASGVVVGKLGTATLTPEELAASFHQNGE